MSFKIQWFLFLFALVGCTTDLQINGDADKQPIEKTKTLQKIVTERKISPADLVIYIEKSKRTLTVKYNGENLITYPCVLGFAPEGDKMQEGDGKTPEGNFKIRAMYPHKSWSYFIWIDYPNATSQERFKTRKAKGLIEKNAKIGGEVGIHGVPEGSNDLIEKGMDWTLGCISLSTEDITDLYQSIGSKTQIEILK